MTLTTTPLVGALAAVELALSAHGITVVRYSPSSAIHRADYRAGLDCLASLGWAGQLIFDDDNVAPDVVGLIEAHARLLGASPTGD